MYFRTVAAGFQVEFGKEPKLFGNPDESVALGASIYAAHNTNSEDLNPLQRQQMQNFSLTEAAPFYFGTIYYNTDEGKTRVRNIINKDEKIPCEFTENFVTRHDNQTAVDCSVTQAGADLDDPPPNMLLTIDPIITGNNI